MNTINNNNKKNENLIEIIPSSIKIHDFEEFLMDIKIFFKIIILKDTYFIWIGNSTPLLGNIAVAMSNHNIDNIPLSTYILGNSTNQYGKLIAQHLAKKTGKQFFISFNIISNEEFFFVIEKRLFQELKTLSII
jgi:proteasome assembly chaperone 4